MWNTVKMQAEACRIRDVKRRVGSSPLITIARFVQVAV